MRHAYIAAGSMILAWVILCGTVLYQGSVIDNQRNTIRQLSQPLPCPGPEVRYQ